MWLSHALLFDGAVDIGEQMRCGVEDVLRFYSTKAVRLIEDAVIKAGAAPHLLADYHPIVRIARAKPDGSCGVLFCGRANIAAGVAVRDPVLYLRDYAGDLDRVDAGGKHAVLSGWI
jgi:hypothetical protein